MAKTTKVNEEFNGDHYVFLSKPYTFEDEEAVKVIDLSGLEGLSGDDLIAIDKIYTSEGNLAPVPEMTIGYTTLIAARVTSKPVEFFRKLPARDVIKVKGAVFGFLNS